MVPKWTNLVDFGKLCWFGELWSLGSSAWLLWPLFVTMGGVWDPNFWGANPKFLSRDLLVSFKIFALIFQFDRVENRNNCCWRVESSWEFISFARLLWQLSFSWFLWLFWRLICVEKARGRAWIRACNKKHLLRVFILFFVYDFLFYFLPLISFFFFIIFFFFETLGICMTKAE